MECLADLGWSGTSTTEVARRAGVSRGAQQHHYPTKMVLVAAALEHLLERQRLAYETAFAVLPPERRNVEGALDLLWEVFRGRPARALLELAVAARTDDELRPLCRDLNERILQVILETFGRLFPATNMPDDAVPTMLRGVFAMFVGLSVQHALDGDAEGHQKAVLAQVKSVARLIIPAPSDVPPDARTDAAPDARTIPWANLSPDLSPDARSGDDSGTAEPPTPEGA
ncbi:TetR/AcrR family transcriptional regulator [Actinomadura logoneensis]|uniref:TetR/AcrR family transcriptional regulator n=2 Tax=Actinomadura logoneensis TaxID=2293572 RepID=A0A372JU53_9ACTN|nr:TetR/AcrR family transcriptional regulator [Actinomadura logoneensis]